MLPIAGNSLHLAAEAQLLEIQLNMVASTNVDCFVYFRSQCCAVASSVLDTN